MMWPRNDSRMTYYSSFKAFTALGSLVTSNPFIRSDQISLNHILIPLSISITKMEYCKKLNGHHLYYLFEFSFCWNMLNKAATFFDFHLPWLFSNSLTFPWLFLSFFAFPDFSLIFRTVATLLNSSKIEWKNISYGPMQLDLYNFNLWGHSQKALSGTVSTLY